MFRRDRIGIRTRRIGGFGFLRKRIGKGERSVVLDVFGEVRQESIANASRNVMRKLGHSSKDIKIITVFRSLALLVRNVIIHNALANIKNLAHLLLHCKVERISFRQPIINFLGHRLRGIRPEIGIDGRKNASFRSTCILRVRRFCVYLPHLPSRWVLSALSYYKNNEDEEKGVTPVLKLP